MRSVDSRVSDWVDLTAHMLSQASPSFPLEEVSSGLLHTFQCRAAYLREECAAGVVRLSVFARNGETFNGHTLEGVKRLMNEAVNSSIYAAHPLIVWFRTVGGEGPQSARRVPNALGARPGFDAAFEVLHEVGADQQLEFPLPHRPGLILGLGVVRDGAEDYSREDLAVAARIRPLFSGLYRQSRVLQKLVAPQELPDLGLTGRELAVLALLAKGCTAASIGWTRGCSPRTVHKHLEHIYRKLGVSDRVSAVLVGHRIDLLPDTRRL